MEKMKAQSIDALSGFFAQSKQLAMHRDSHTIAKLKPKIRIIQIVAPEIIKTDVENFRGLVQKLTGKSAEVKGRSKKACRVVQPKGISSTNNCSKLWTNIQPQDHHQGIHILQGAQGMKKEIEYLYKGENNSHGIFGSFGDMDLNFVQDVLPFKSSQSHINDLFGEMPLC